MRVLLHMGLPYTMVNPCTKRMSAIAKELKKRGHEVIILAPDTPGVEQQNDVVYYKTRPLIKKTIVNRLLNECGSAVNSLIIGKKQNCVDIVLTSCPPALVNTSGALIAKKHKAKLIYDVRDIWPDIAHEMGSFSEGSIYSKTFSFIRNYMLKKADLVTTVSDGKVKKLYSYNPTNQVMCIPNGFNTDFFGEQINQELYDNIRSKGKIICTYTGNIGLAQGIGQLIRIAEKCRDEEIPIYFLIYGSGAEENKIEQLIKEKDLRNISIEGMMSNKDMRTVHEASDIDYVSLVNSNLKDSVPTKMYEALGVGCPVFLVAEGDAVKILRDVGLGVDASPNDNEQIWDRFKDMYYSLDVIKNKKEQAIKKIRDLYSLQASAQKLVDEMERMVRF